MKKLLAIALSLLLTLAFSGCSTKSNENQSKTPITINMPDDNTVNGYRKENSNESKIVTSSIVVTENTQSYSLGGNKNSKKFHKVGCSSFKKTKESNKVYYKTRDEFINKNYTPCKICNP